MEDYKQMAKNDFTIRIPSLAKETMPLPDPELLQFYRDCENRVIWLIDEIGDEVYSIIQMILHFNKEDEDIEPEKRKPIRLIIASPGGSLECARSLVAVMRLSVTPIYTIAVGSVASAASMIYLASNRKYATQGASFLFHQGSCDNISGNYAEVIAFMYNYQKVISDMMEFYKTHTKFPSEVIEENIQQDWYISLDEALENGVVDEVIEDISILL